jgi:hypothetical protein
MPGADGEGDLTCEYDGAIFFQKTVGCPMKRGDVCRALEH